MYYGGPVELDKGFILHTNDYKSDKNQIELGNNLILSSDFSTIKEIVLGGGPSKSILALGYTGWSSFQLHAELKKNDWFELNLDTDIIFAKNSAVFHAIIMRLILSRNSFFNLILNY